MEMHHELYANQTAFASAPWTSLAQRAAITDYISFKQCLQNPLDSVHVARVAELARRLGVRGTPTVVVNGWLLDPSTPERVEAATIALLQGKSPKL